MKKCFDGIAHLDFDPDLDILAALDAPPPKGERLEFTYDQCAHKMINPKDSGALTAFYEGAFTSMRLVSRREGAGWFLGPFGPRRDTRPRLSREASRMVMTTPSRRRVDGVDVDGTPSRRRRARIGPL